MLLSAHYACPVPQSSADAEWPDLLASTPAGWYVGTPAYNGLYRHWEIYAYDTTEDVPPTQRSREWTAVAPTEERVIREMARCLRLIAAGEVPR